MTWDTTKIKTDMKISPIEVSILMQVYHTPLFHVDTNINNNRNALTLLEYNGLIETYSSELIHITDKGRAVVEKMCDTEMPTMKWVWE